MVIASPVLSSFKVSCVVSDVGSSVVTHDTLTPMSFSVTFSTVTSGTLSSGSDFASSGTDDF